MSLNQFEHTVALYHSYSCLPLFHDRIEKAKDAFRHECWQHYCETHEAFNSDPKAFVTVRDQIFRKWSEQNQHQLNHHYNGVDDDATKARYLSAGRVNALRLIKLRDLFDFYLAALPR